MVRVCLTVVNLSLLVVHKSINELCIKHTIKKKIFEAMLNVHILHFYNYMYMNTHFHTSRYSDIIPKHFNVEV